MKAEWCQSKEASENFSGSISNVTGDLCCTNEICIQDWIPYVMTPVEMEPAPTTARWIHVTQFETCSAEVTAAVFRQVIVWSMSCGLSEQVVDDIHNTASCSLSDYLLKHVSFRLCKCPFYELVQHIIWMLDAYNGHLQTQNKTTGCRWLQQTRCATSHKAMIWMWWHTQTQLKLFWWQDTCLLWASFAFLLSNVGSWPLTATAVE